MFQQSKWTQMALYLNIYIVFVLAEANDPDMVAGHLYVPPSGFVVPETTECWDDDGKQGLSCLLV